LEKKITVITVVRNAEKILTGTLNSVNEQTFRPYSEYILVDGASTDGTLELILSAAEKKILDRWVSEPDSGIYDAMNKGASMATTDWIIFMNAGDFFHGKGALEALYGETEKHSGCAGVYGGCIMTYPDGREYKENPLIPRKIYTQMICSHQSLLLRTDKVREYAFNTSFRIAADHHQMMRMVAGFEEIWPLNLTVSKVTLETYSWAEVLKGLREKRRALWEVTHNVFFYLMHSVKMVISMLKHFLKTIGVRRKGGNLSNE